MNKLDQIFQSSDGAADFARGYLDHLARVIRNLDAVEIADFVAVLEQARERGAQIFFLGNGGSAATASHFANDIAIGTRTGDDRPFRALSLADNAAVMTAIANDDGYDEIFVQQLQILIRPGDVVVAISASGRSPNVVKAIEYANDHSAITVAITGFGGGQLKEIARHSVHVPTDEGEYGPVEDTHLILDHLVGAYLARRVRAGESE